MRLMTILAMAAIAFFFFFFGLAAIVAGLDEFNPANIFGGLIMLLFAAWIGLLIYDVMNWTGKNR